MIRMKRVIRHSVMLVRNKRLPTFVKLFILCTQSSECRGFDTHRKFVFLNKGKIFVIQHCLFVIQHCLGIIHILK